MKNFLVKIDKVMTGLIVACILPIVGFFVSFLVKGGHYPFEKYVDLALRNSMDQQDILIFCLIPNMFLFYFANFRWHINEFTKGLVAITIVLLLILVIMTY